MTPRPPAAARNALVSRANEPEQASAVQVESDSDPNETLEERMIAGLIEDADRDREVAAAWNNAAPDLPA